MIETTSELARQKAAQLIAGCDFTPTHPSFFIEWDEDSGQFKMASDNDASEGDS